MIPSALLMRDGVPVKKLKAKIVSRTETPIQSGISNFIFCLFMDTGKKMAVRPRIPRMLKMFEPTILPMATSELPSRAPMTLTVSSGIDVPIPTIAAPMTKSETLYLRAMDTAPATRQSAPKTMPANVRISMTYSILI